MSTTQTGVQEGSQKQADLADLDKKDDAKARAEFDAAKPKGFEDLPADHPMARRAAMLAEIEANNAQLDAGREPDEADTAAAIARAAGDLATEDKPVANEPAKKAATEAEEQVKAQSEAPKDGEAVVLSLEDLAKYQVRIKVDGEEQLVSATKVLGQFQKGAAADVRLASATKLQKEAQAALEEARKQAQQAVTSAATTTQKVVAQSKVEATQEAKEKFQEAAEALYAGDAEKASVLFSEATALALEPTVAKATSAIDQSTLVNSVAESVTQQLSQKAALKQLFKDYPEIEEKKAFAMIADEYANAFMANGDDVATAIGKAGEAIGEEYGLGKFKAKPSDSIDIGRPIKNNGAPTNRADKLSAKEELDVIQSGNARAPSGDAPEQSVSDTLSEMRKARVGQTL